MHRLKTFRALLLLLVAVIGLSVTVTFDRLAIPEGKLIFTGRVLNDKGQVLDSVKISLRDSSNRRTFTTYYTDKRGKFKIKLDYGQVRNVHFEVDGYVAMFARFETEVPSSKIYNDYYFDARIDLLNDTMDFNKKTIARNAFMTVRFNSSLDHFAESFNKQMTFFEQLAKPNLGLIKLRGYVRDSLLDTINVRLSAYDMNTNEVLDTALTAYDGYYEMEVPLQREVKVQLESKEHYPVYTTMKTIVPTKLVQKDFELNKSFDLIPRDNEDVNRQAFALPLDAIVFDSSKTTFSSQPKVVEKFEEVLNSFPKTIKLAGKLNNVEGRDFVGTTIMVKDGNRLIKETKLDSSNSFEVEMPYQSIVHVNFKTTGYHEGFISYNTNMSKSEMHNAAQLKTDVELYNKDRTDINAKAFEFPMAKYYYDKKQKGFTPDTAISNAFYKALHEINVKRDSTPAAAGFLVLTGSVKNPATNKRVPEAKLRVLDAQKNVLSYFNADKRARFNMRLNLNRIYYVELESPGYHNTLLKFNTHVSKGKENTDIEQDGLEALIIHEQDILAGKPVPAELMKDRAVTSFYYAEEEGIFVEDLSTFDNFRIAVENYKPKEIEKIEEKALPPDPMLLLTGVVKDKKNFPVPGVSVALMEKKKATTTTITDFDGKYKIEVPYNKQSEVRFSGSNIYPTSIMVNATLPADKEETSDTTTVPPLTAYNLDDPDVNPEAFKSPWQKIYYDAGLKSFLADKDVANTFETTLNTVPDNRLLYVEGKTVNPDGKAIGNTRLYVVSKNQVLDSVTSDNRGRYALRLPYQREYRITTRQRDYYETYAAVSTKTANANEKLIDKRLKNFDIVLVRKDAARVNPSTVYSPTALARYDAAKDEFVIDEEVDQRYLASLFLPEPKEEPQENTFQLTAEEVKSVVEVTDQTEARENLQTNVVKQFVASKNQSVKNDIMQDFHQTLRGVNKSFNYENLRNINLETQNIQNTGFEVENNTGGRLDADDIATMDARNLINEIAAGIFGFRKGQIRLFSLDSTLTIQLNTRIYRTSEGFGVYQVTRNKVLGQGNAIEYVHVQDWWFIDTYYRNGEKISESVYEKEMEDFEKNGVVIARQLKKTNTLNDGSEDS